MSEHLNRMLRLRQSQAEIAKEKFPKLLVKAVDGKSISTDEMTILISVGSFRSTDFFQGWIPGRWKLHSDIIEKLQEN